MRIIIDKRESGLYEKCQEMLSKQTVPFNLTLTKEELKIGDMLFQSDDFQDILLIERKSFADLLASIKDGRYEEQSHRLLNASNLPPHSIIYLLEGMFTQLSNPKDKRTIYSSMTTLQFFKGFSVYRVSSLQETAEWMLYMADKIDRELERGKIPYYFSSPFLNMYRKIEGKSNLYLPNSNPDFISRFNFFNMDSSASEFRLESANTIIEQPTNYCNFVKKVKKDNVTPENIGEIILCQIPGISSVTAITIMKQYDTFPKLISALQENPSCLDGITCESSNGKSRKISKSSIENIRNFLLGPVNSN
jgi:ERCC4-type nuclease